MQIIFKRRLTNELLTTYLPTILLILIGYCTTFFKSFFFEAALTVNVTTMLVMTTIFISVMEKLPPTSYVRMIDIWLIFGILVPFLEVCILTIKEYYNDDSKINHHGVARIVGNFSRNDERMVKYATDILGCLLIIDLLLLIFNLQKGRSCHFSQWRFQ